MKNGLLLKSNPLFFLPTSPLGLVHSNKTHHSFISIQLSKHKLLSFHLKLPSASPVSASTKLQTQDFDYEFDEEFDQDEDEDEDIIVPLRNMRQWTRNKPLGFGEGKLYDTTIEDKLMQELEQSRVAQLANLNNLKNNPEDGNPSSKNQNLPKQKVPELVPNGVRVRLVHLPKKKNIHRDLQAAFKPFSGIINITPAVSGNEKTREPVCKGFAFVDFKSEKEANRFVETFSTQPITFGKVEKQIKCEIMKPNAASIKPIIHRTINRLPISNPGAVINTTPVIETSIDRYAAMDNSDDDDLVIANEDKKRFDSLNKVVQEKQEAEEASESLKKEKKVKEKGKRKVENTQKLSIPGSANRLKMKEKALLSGVFSKYGGKIPKEIEVNSD